MKGFRGEPWSTDGRLIYDRNGESFARMHDGCEEFAHTIVKCVNLLTNLPIRSSDLPGATDFQKHALEILARESQLRGDDLR